MLVALQRFFAPCPDDAVLKLYLPVKAEGPNVTDLVRQRRAVLVADGQRHIGGEKAHPVHKTVVEAVCVRVASHQIVEHIFNGIAVFPVFADAPAQLHALAGLHHAALAGLLGKVGAHVPAGQGLIGPLLVGDGEVRDGQVAVVPAGEIKLGTLVGGGRPGLGDVGRAVVL